MRKVAGVEVLRNPELATSGGSLRSTPATRLFNISCDFKIDEDFCVLVPAALRGNVFSFDALRRETDAERQRAAFRRRASEREIAERLFCRLNSQFFELFGDVVAV